MINKNNVNLRDRDNKDTFVNKKFSKEQWFWIKYNYI